MLYLHTVCKVFISVPQTEEKFLNGFRNNVAYVKLLAELELLKEPLKSDDEDTGSVDELSLGSTSETASLSSLTLTLDHREGITFLVSVEGGCPGNQNGFKIPPMIFGNMCFVIPLPRLVQNPL